MKNLLAQNGHIARTLLVGLVGVLIPAVLLITIYKDRRIEPPAPRSPQLQPSPRVAETLACDRLGDRKTELYRLPGPLSQATIGTILVTDDAVWLGTDRGLILFRPTENSVVYRNYAQAAIESVDALAAAGDRLLVAISHGDGSGKRTAAGSFLFDPKSGQFEPVGPYSRSLAWDDDRIWAEQGQSLFTFDRQPDGHWLPQAVTLDPSPCGAAGLIVADDAIWLLPATPRPQASSGGGPLWSDSSPCGLLRFDPTGGSTTRYATAQGLLADTGSALVADSRELWIAHDDSGDGLSRFDFAQQSWSALPRSSNDLPLGANRISLSSRSVWLATPDPEHPLLQLDRDSLAAHAIDLLPPGRTVTALGSRFGQTWVAAVARVLDPADQSERNESLLARLRD